jgi:hypothetical protein
MKQKSGPEKSPLVSRCGRRRLKHLIEEQQIQFQRPLRLGDSR